MPRTAATVHQPPAKIRVASSPSWFAATTVTAPSAVADPPISSTVSRKRSTNSISRAPRPGPGPGSANARNTPRNSSVPPTTASACLGELRRRLGGADADADGAGQAPAATSERRARKASRSVRSSPPNSARSAGFCESSRFTAVPLSIPEAGRISSTLRPQRGSRSAFRAAAAISPARRSAASSSAAPRQCRAWIGPLSSSRSPAPLSAAASSSANEVAAA